MEGNVRKRATGIIVEPVHGDLRLTIEVGGSFNTRSTYFTQKAEFLCSWGADCFFGILRRKTIPELDVYIEGGISWF